MLGAYDWDCNIQDQSFLEQMLTVVYEMVWTFCHRRPGLAQLNGRERPF